MTTTLGVTRIVGRRAVLLTSSRRLATSSHLRTANASTQVAHAQAQGRFDGRVVIVTGGSRGIGEGVSRVFAREKAHVVLCGLPRHGSGGRALATEINAAGGSALYMDADLRHEAAVVGLVDAAVSTFGRVS